MLGLKLKGVTGRGPVYSIISNDEILLGQWNKELLLHLKAKLENMHRGSQWVKRLDELGWQANI